ncbi:hypothetical protein B0H17DRAFT_1274047 [Mycena rosella]|uniref:PIPK domain-containing protein n=1 Tax=Mycena rosella TaxID=1033263 RepID=A0AAD7MAS5_MYCRO|nr:hypothetical protein B0H17DRAFT_1274047 [Mycena rosella]
MHRKGQEEPRFKMKIFMQSTYINVYADERRDFHDAIMDYGVPEAPTTLQQCWFMQGRRKQRQRPARRNGRYPQIPAASETGTDLRKPESMNERHCTIKGRRTSPEAIAIRRAMREWDPKRLGHGRGTIRLPEDTGDRRDFLIYQDEGGLRATDQGSENLDKIYYLGVINVLTPYSTVKKLEHFWKGLSADRHKISPVEPGEYGDRFFAFMKAIMRGGGGGERFKAE